MKILIGIPSGERPRSHDFYRYLAVMDKYSNTVTSIVNGQSPARARNMLIEEAITKKCTHIFFLDDDILVQKDTLYRLSMHNKDIISGLYLLRSTRRPCIFEAFDEQKRCQFMDITGKRGLTKAAVAGFGCMLIKLSCLDRLTKPYCRLGELNPEEWTDDTGFCYRAGLAGIEIFVDLEATVGHITEVQMWPMLNEQNEWIGITKPFTSLEE